MPKRIPETALYPPVKRFLEARGLVAKGEVRGCDVVAVAPAAPEMPVVVELKRAVTLAAVLQCLDRFAVTDLVYLAVPAEAAERAGRKGIARLFRRLGLGLLAVGTGASRGEVEVLTEPLATPRRLPRRNAARARAIIAEHVSRQGDPNPGGVRGGVRLVTAYRQEALRCAAVLHASPGGAPLPVRVVRERAEAPNAGRILYRNVYGWFEPAGRDLYRLTECGARALADLQPQG